MENIEDEQISSVNHEAREKRHKKLIKENPSFFKRKFKKDIASLVSVLSYKNFISIFNRQSENIWFLKNNIGHSQILVQDLPCQKKFIKKLSYFVLALFLLSSIDVYNFDFQNAYARDNNGLFESLNLVADDEGYLTKAMPTGDHNYSNREGVIVHKVQPGENISSIAYMYGLRTATILDNNPTLGSGNYIKAGQELTILPTDGYLYTIKKGDTLSKIAKEFKIEEDKIKELNPDYAEDLQVDHKLVLAGIRAPKVTRYIASTRSTGAYRTGAIIGNVNVPSQTPNVIGFVSPTPVNARYSRGFTSWHPALDISRRDKSYQPNMVAPISGTVIKVRETGWNGGYGSHLIIDRGDGVKVLMAHFQTNKIYVKEGDYVSTGQIVGMMGTTGRSTGVHLHVEVIVNGVKQNPLNYFQI